MPSLKQQESRNSASVVLALALANGCAHRPIDLGADLRGDVVNGRYVHPEGRFSSRLPFQFLGSSRACKSTWMGTRADST